MTLLDRQTPFTLPHVYITEGPQKVRLDNDISAAVFVALEHIGDRKDDCDFILWGGFDERIKQDMRNFKFMNRRFPVLGMPGYIGLRVIWFKPTEAAVWMICFEGMEPEKLRNLYEHRLGLFGMIPGFAIAKKPQSQPGIAPRWECHHFKDYARASYLKAVVELTRDL